MDKNSEYCEACQSPEQDMHSQVPVEKAPKRAPNRHARFIAAGATLVLTLLCIWWLYDMEFHYPNTEAGRLAAVKDYITDPADSSMDHDLKEGTPLRAIAWQESHGKLFIFYGADNRDNVHGIIELTRGLNGKYRTDQASRTPFPYSAGVMVSGISGRNQDLDLIAIAGDNCQGIHSVAISYTYGIGQLQTKTSELIYPVPEANFLWLLEKEDVREQLGAAEGGEVRRHEVRFLDREGNDITQEFQDDSVSQSWGGSKSTAEQFLLYVYIGIVAVLGLVCIRSLLRRD